MNTSNQLKKSNWAESSSKRHVEEDAASGLFSIYQAIGPVLG